MAHSSSGMCRLSIARQKAVPSLQAGETRSESPSSFLLLLTLPLVVESGCSFNSGCAMLPLPTQQQAVRSRPRKSPLRRRSYAHTAPRTVKPVSFARVLSVKQTHAAAIAGKPLLNPARRPARGQAAAVKQRNARSEKVADRSSARPATLATASTGPPLHNTDVEIKA